MAAINVFLFFVFMLTAYYTYTIMFHHFFPKQYMIAWGGFALLSPFCAYVVWYARGNGWVAAVCAALPISLLILEGYSFYYTLIFAQGFDLMAAILLLFVLPKNKRQCFCILPLVILFCFLMQRTHLISMLFGGL